MYTFCPTKMNKRQEGSSLIYQDWGFTPLSYGISLISSRAAKYNTMPRPWDQLRDLCMLRSGSSAAPLLFPYVCLPLSVALSSLYPPPQYSPESPQLLPPPLHLCFLLFNDVTSAKAALFLWCAEHLNSWFRESHRVFWKPDLLLRQNTERDWLWLAR